MDVVDPAAPGVGVDVDPVAELIEDDVVPQRHRAGGALRINAVPVTEVGLLPPVVVDEAAVDLDIRLLRVRVESDPAVVHDQVDELEVRRVGDYQVRPRAREAVGVGVHDLEAPKRHIAPADDEEVAAGCARGPAIRVEDRALTGVLPHHDRSRRGARHGGVDRARIGAAAQPDRVARLHLAVAAVQGRRQVPGASHAAVPPTAAAGRTGTGAPGTGVTVTVAVPLFPSLVAVIVAVPTVTPVTSPVADTVATDVALVAHVTTRPDSGFPAASFGVAVS